MILCSIIKYHAITKFEIQNNSILPPCGALFSYLSIIAFLMRITGGKHYGTFNRKNCDHNRRRQSRPYRRQILRGSIGYGIATAYAKEGANLVLTGRNMQKLTDAKTELEDLYK